MSLKYFGTDGIRGEYGKNPLTPELVRRLGFALGRYLEKKYPDQPRHVVIGRDPRASGEEIEALLSEGLCLRDAHIFRLGIVPTPAVSLVVDELHAQLGIAITASHNPASDNGIKLFSKEGTKLPLSEEAFIEELMAEARPPKDRKVSTCGFDHDGEAIYVNYLRSLLHQGCLHDWRIVLDTANGATCKTSPAVLKHYGAEIIHLGDDPAGHNINQGVGSEHPEKLAQAVRQHKADLGIAHDGDGDRVVLCDELGNIVDGEKVLGILAWYALSRNKLGANTLVTTIQSNTALDTRLAKLNAKVERVDIGDRHVAHRMKELEATLGGENSGHIICQEHLPTGDGLIAALKIIEVMQASRRKLSSLATEFPLYPQKMLSLKVPEKVPLEKLHTLQAARKTLESQLSGAGRILIRYSGTEPKIRLMVEGEDPDMLEKGLEKLREALEEDLQVAL